ncbi:MAG: hypothetical protein HQ547_04030 [Candidatus Omnitrophica bacterium]|nr:hypothetical protein [Candidatus Omnitrophota bacterium]
MRLSKKDFHIKRAFPVVILLLVLTSNAVAASGAETLRKLAFIEQQKAAGLPPTTDEAEFKRRVDEWIEEAELSKRYGRWQVLRNGVVWLGVSENVSFTQDWVNIIPRSLERELSKHGCYAYGIECFEGAYALLKYLLDSGYTARLRHGRAAGIWRDHVVVEAKVGQKWITINVTPDLSRFDVKLSGSKTYLPAVADNHFSQLGHCVPFNNSVAPMLWSSYGDGVAVIGAGMDVLPERISGETVASKALRMEIDTLPLDFTWGVVVSENGAKEHLTLKLVLNQRNRLIDLKEAVLSIPPEHRHLSFRIIAKLIADGRIPFASFHTPDDLQTEIGQELVKHGRLFYDMIANLDLSSVLLDISFLPQECVERKLQEWLTSVDISYDLSPESQERLRNSLRHYLVNKVVTVIFPHPDPSDTLPDNITTITAAAERLPNVVRILKVDDRTRSVTVADSTAMFERLQGVIDQAVDDFLRTKNQAFARKAARKDPFIAQHIQTIATKFNVAESGVAVLSVPAGLEEVGGIHGGTANYIYHVPGRDVVVRILNVRVMGGYSGKIEALRTRLFPDGANNDTRVVPIWEIGEMTFERHNTSVTLPYVLMPFMRGESLLPYLAENPQRRLWALLGVIRNVYEFHRRLVLTVDYKPEHFKVDTSNANFPIRLFDYVESSAVLDLSDQVQRTMVWRLVQYNLLNIEALISAILGPMSEVIADEDMQAIQPLLTQLMQPLSDCNGQEVERIYGQEIFPFFERLMEKYASALATAQPATAQSVTDIGAEQARIALEGI